MTRFSFTIAATDGAARTGVIAMQRGVIRTPAFMPVGTAAMLKAKRLDMSRHWPQPSAWSIERFYLRPGMRDRKSVV